MLPGPAASPRRVPVLAAAELPAAVAADLDRDRVVALGVERVQDRARRGERDLVLARAAAHDDGDRDADAAGSRDASAAACRRPAHEAADGDRDRRPLPASLPPVGLWSSTIPSRPGSVDVRLHLHLEARARERVAAPTARPGWSRRAPTRSSGPFETLSVIVEPGRAESRSGSGRPPVGRLVALDIHAR